MKIFFSWQSDISNQRDYVLKALERAKSRFNFPIEIVQATDGSIGSARIDEQLFRNIDECDIFFGDVTIVSSPAPSAPLTLLSSSLAAASLSSATASTVPAATAATVTVEEAEPCPNSRACPNPNVLTEVGYAFSKLGFERVVLLANTEFGTLESLPFDIRNRRCIGFSAKKSLRKDPPTVFIDTLEDAIANVIKSFPLQVMKFLQKLGVNGAKYVSAMSVVAHELQEQLKVDCRIYFPVEVGMGGKASLELSELSSDPRYSFFGVESMPSVSTDTLEPIVFRGVSTSTIKTLQIFYVSSSALSFAWPKVTAGEHRLLYGNLVGHRFSDSDPHYMVLVSK